MLCWPSVDGHHWRKTTGEQRLTQRCIPHANRYTTRLVVDGNSPCASLASGENRRFHLKTAQLEQQPSKHAG